MDCGRQGGNVCTQKRYYIRKTPAGAGRGSELSQKGSDIMSLKAALKTRKERQKQDHRKLKKERRCELQCKEKMGPVRRRGGEPDHSN